MKISARLSRRGIRGISFFGLSLIFILFFQNAGVIQTSAATEDDDIVNEMIIQAALAEALKSRIFSPDEIANLLYQDVLNQLNQPENAKLKSDFHMAVSGGSQSDTRQMLFGMYALATALIPKDASKAYVENLKLFCATYVRDKLFTYAYETRSLAKTDGAAWRAGIFEYALIGLAKWTVQNPPAAGIVVVLDVSTSKFYVVMSPVKGPELFGQLIQISNLFDAQASQLNSLIQQRPMVGTNPYIGVDILADYFNAL